MPFEGTTMSTTELGTVGSRSIFRLDSILKYCDIIAIRVPIGFQTDLASVPRIPFVFWLWGDRAHRPAVLHDYLYRIDSNPYLSKDVADLIFYQAIRDSEKKKGGVKGWLKAYIIAIPMYLGVVLGGGSSFHQKRVTDQFIDWIEPVQ